MKKKIIGILCAVAAFALLRSQPLQLVYGLPDRAVLYKGEDIQAVTEAYSLSGISTVLSGSNTAAGNHQSVDITLLGVKLKTVEITYEEPHLLMPGGSCVGVALFTEGIIVVGSSDITVAPGKKVNPAEKAGLHNGDIILSINGNDGLSMQEIGRLAAQNGETPIKMLVQSDGRQKEITVTPVYDYYEKQYRLGLWLRDSAAGIGTLTYADNATLRYGALGHAVCEPDTGVVMPLKYGEIVQCSINGIKKGKKGTAGELEGSFKADAEAIGTVEANNRYGIYGKLNSAYCNKLYPKGLNAASAQTVHTGKATVLASINNDGIREYEIEIVRVNKQEVTSIKNMIIEVTDPRLLQQTGGIVQGMSGSPILQDGRIVGAVTHVLINEPTKGYGLFISNMID